MACGHAVGGGGRAAGPCRAGPRAPPPRRRRLVSASGLTPARPGHRAHSTTPLPAARRTCLTLLRWTRPCRRRAGQLLDGRYRVDSRLAQGGMATVYLGRDIRLDRVVAAQDRPRRAGRGRRVRPPLHHRGPRRRPAVQPQRGRASSTRARSATSTTSSWSTCPARRCARCSSARGGLSPGGAGHHRGRADRPGRRAPGGHHPPRRQARERAARPGRRGQGRRLRAGPRGRRGRPAPRPA